MPLVASLQVCRVSDSIPVKPNLEDFWNLEAIGIMETKEDIPKNQCRYSLEKHWSDEL